MPSPLLVLQDVCREHRPLGGCSGRWGSLRDSEDQEVCVSRSGGLRLSVSMTGVLSRGELLVLRDRMVLLSRCFSACAGAELLHPAVDGCEAQD